MKNKPPRIFTISEEQVLITRATRLFKLANQDKELFIKSGFTEHYFDAVEYLLIDYNEIINNVKYNQAIRNDTEVKINAQRLIYQKLERVFNALDSAPTLSRFYHVAYNFKRYKKLDDAKLLAYCKHIVEYIQKEKEFFESKSISDDFISEFIQNAEDFNSTVEQLNNSKQQLQERIDRRLSLVTHINDKAQIISSIGKQLFNQTDFNRYFGYCFNNTSKQNNKQLLKLEFEQNIEALQTVEHKQ
jgi:hypothetical protein